MGVADGIYSWRESGIDSGILSQALMKRSRSLIEAGAEDVFKGEEAEVGEWHRGGWGGGPCRVV